MNHRTQILSIGSLALLCVIASSGCENVELASNVSSGQSRGFRRDNVVFEPSMGTMSLRPEANPERSVYYGDLHVHTEYSFDAFAFSTVATPRDAYRYANWKGSQEPVVAPWKARHLAGGYGQIHYRMVYGAPSHAPRSGTAEVERATG